MHCISPGWDWSRGAASRSTLRVRPLSCSRSTGFLSWPGPGKKREKPMREDLTQSRVRAHAVNDAEQAAALLLLLFSVSNGPPLSKKMWFTHFSFKKTSTKFEQRYRIPRITPLNALNEGLLQREALLKQSELRNPVRPTTQGERPNVESAVWGKRVSCPEAPPLVKTKIKCCGAKRNLENFFDLLRKTFQEVAGFSKYYTGALKSDFHHYAANCANKHQKARSRHFTLFSVWSHSQRCLVQSCQRGYAPPKHLAPLLRDLPAQAFQ